MKRLLKVFSLLFILFLTSCTLPGAQKPTETYTIKYYVEGVLVESTSYEKGETPELYLYQINPGDNAVFDGWYDNPTYTGELITGISKDSTGNLTYYGRILEEKTIDLSSLLSINNYSYVLVDSVYNDVLEYKITERIQELYCIQFSEYSYYLEYLDDASRFTYNDQNNWYYSLDGENAYSSYIDFFNLNLNFLSQFLLDLSTNFFNVGTFLTNDYTWTSSMNHYCYALRMTNNFYFRNISIFALWKIFNHFTDFNIF